MYKYIRVPPAFRLPSNYNWSLVCSGALRLAIGLSGTPTLPELRDAVVMKLVFTKSSPLNTVLVDKTNGQVVYEIETEKRFLSKTTVIRKPFTSAPFLPRRAVPPPLLTWSD